MEEFRSNFVAFLENMNIKNMTVFPGENQIWNYIYILNLLEVVQILMLAWAMKPRKMPIFSAT